MNRYEVIAVVASGLTWAGMGLAVWSNQVALKALAVIDAYAECPVCGGPDVLRGGQCRECERVTSMPPTCGVCGVAVVDEPGEPCGPCVHEFSRALDEWAESR